MRCLLLCVFTKIHGHDNPNEYMYRRRFADYTPATHESRNRSYAFRDRHLYPFKSSRWARFLNGFTSWHLQSATKLLDMHTVKDLDEDGSRILDYLRKYHDVLMLESDAPFSSFKMQLYRLHQYGIVNLSIALPEKQQTLNSLQSELRSLKAQLRESKKKIGILERQVNEERAGRLKAEAELEKKHRLLKVAEAQVASFRAEYPDWRPPELKLLTSSDDKDFRHMFEVLDKDIDLEKQMERDPSGSKYHIYTMHTPYTCMSCVHTHVHTPQGC